MRILHISIRAPYNDNWSYQENLLPMYQQRAGHEVTLIVSNKKHAHSGNLMIVEEKKYVDKNGVTIVRKDFDKFLTNKLGYILAYAKIYDVLCEIKPDYIMIHGLMSIITSQVIRYKRKENSKCIIVCDNHLDSLIHDTIGIKSRILTKYFKFRNYFWQRYYDKVYGVTPWRSDYARYTFGINKNKISTLYMGADDLKIQYNEKEVIRKKIHDKYNLPSNNFIFISGGKLDSNKKVLELMKAFREIEHHEITLLIFGDYCDDIKLEFEDLLEKDERIVYIGFQETDEIYNLFLASDFGVFPGRHSVLWEQAVACGLPCAFKKYVQNGFVNVNGNSIFLENDSIMLIKETLENVFLNKDFYSKMSLSAKRARECFLYSHIAANCLNEIDI